MIHKDTWDLLQFNKLELESPENPAKISFLFGKISNEMERIVTEYTIKISSLKISKNNNPR